MKHIQETPNGPVLVDGPIPRGVTGNDDMAAVRKFQEDAVAAGDAFAEVTDADGNPLALFADPEMMTEDEMNALAAVSPAWTGVILQAAGLRAEAEKAVADWVPDPGVVARIKNAQEDKTNPGQGNQ